MREREEYELDTYDSLTPISGDEGRDIRRDDDEILVGVVDSVRSYNRAVRVRPRSLEFVPSAQRPDRALVSSDLVAVRVLTVGRGVQSRDLRADRETVVDGRVRGRPVEIGIVVAAVRVNRCVCQLLRTWRGLDSCSLRPEPEAGRWTAELSGPR